MRFNKYYGNNGNTYPGFPCMQRLQNLLFLINSQKQNLWFCYAEYLLNCIQLELLKNLVIVQMWTATFLHEFEYIRL